MRSNIVELSINAPHDPKLYFTCDILELMRTLNPTLRSLNGKLCYGSASAHTSST